MLSGSRQWLIVVAFISVFMPEVSWAKDPFPPGKMIQEIQLSCSHSDFVVLGEFEDVLVEYGQSDWTTIDDSEVTYYCGKFEGKISCLDNATAVRVSRTSRWALVFQCYKS